MWPIGAEFLKTVFPNSKISVAITGVSTDSRAIELGQMFVAISGDKFDGHDFVLDLLSKGHVCALVSEDWAMLQPIEIRDRLLYSGPSIEGFREFAKAFRDKFNFPVFGIGGSNGKTTTKEILAALLSGRDLPVVKTEKSENGYIGIAKSLTQNSIQKTEKIGAMVLEIGIDSKRAMAEHMTMSHPDCVMITALGPEHLEGLGAWDDAVHEEMDMFRLSTGKPRIWQLSERRIWEFSRLLEPQDCLVIHEEDISRGTSNFDHAKLADFNLLHWHLESDRPDRTKVFARWIEKNAEVKFLSFTIPIPGQHNATNFALALAAALHMGWKENEVYKGWQNFTPPPMRSRVVELQQGICLYDDCYNASPASMKAAFSTLDHGDWKERHKIVILGDMLDLGEESLRWHLDIIPSMLAISNAVVFLYGDAMGKVYNSLNSKLKTRIFHIPLSHNPVEVFSTRHLDITGSIILVKGSRSMKLEKVVKFLESTYGKLKQ
jgi:UDP-N-acetylmuramoyl-tripeptide--D-alanyl-D-alanine ligase